MSTERDLVWLPKELAARIKELEGLEALETEIKKYVAETYSSLKIDVESMDEEIVQYRAYMIKARDAFKKAKDEELDAFYGLWEKYDTDLGKVRQYVASAKKELQPLLDELKEVKKAVEGVETWGLERLTKAVKGAADLYGQEKEMFMFLVNNWRKPKD